MSVVGLPKVRVRVCADAELAVGDVKTAWLSMHGRQRRQAMVVRDASGALHAYLNECRHIPIPLDAYFGTLLENGHLRCLTHGALYRFEDGECVRGPCRGQHLERLQLEREGDDIYVLDAVASPG